MGGAVGGLALGVAAAPVVLPVLAVEAGVAAVAGGAAAAMGAIGAAVGNQVEKTTHYKE